MNNAAAAVHGWLTAEWNKTRVQWRRLCLLENVILMWCCSVGTVFIMCLAFRAMTLRNSVLIWVQLFHPSIITNTPPYITFITVICIHNILEQQCSYLMLPSSETTDTLGFFDSDTLHFIHYRCMLSVITVLHYTAVKSTLHILHRLCCGLTIPGPGTSCHAIWLFNTRGEEGLQQSFRSHGQIWPWTSCQIVSACFLWHVRTKCICER